jgi:hypothetical protein
LVGDYSVKGGERMTTRRAVGIVVATDALLVAVLVVALWAVPSVAAVLLQEQAAAVLGASGRHPAEAEPTPVAGGPGYYSVQAGTMQPYDYTIQWLEGQYDDDGWISTIQESSLKLYTEFGAALHLPQGAYITKVVAYAYDDDPSEDLAFCVVRYALGATPTRRVVAEWTQTGTDEGTFVAEANAVSAEVALVDNSVYSYAVEVTLPKASSGKGLRALMFRVDYSFDSYVPLAMKGTRKGHDW